MNFRQSLSNVRRFLSRAGRTLTQGSKPMPITAYTHPEYDRFAPLWEKVSDACAGQDALKARSPLYLPDPSEGREGDRAHADARYRGYCRRAVYLNATGRTLSALVGIAYANWPRVVLPRGLNYLLEDADGSGVGLINQSQWVLSEVLKKGRVGLLADATTLDETEALRDMSVAQLREIGHRFLVAAYSAESILTWELDRGRLTRLVLSEIHHDYTGGEVWEVPQLRELLLVEGRCQVRLWRQYTAAGQFHLVSDVATSFARIPFTFIGATNNDATPDQPPLLDLANVNLAHFQNSADFEESVFLNGQPQLVFEGATKEWAEEADVVFGARAALVTPPGTTAKLLQVQPNTLVREAMRDKEQMMAALGARLLGPGGKTMTATQSAAETKSAYSQLSLAADNVSEGYRKTLAEIAGLAGSGEVDFAIDTRFNDLALDANALRETVAAWQAGMVPTSDAWAVLRRLGVVDQGKSDEQLRDELDAQGPALDLDRAA